MSIPHGYDAQTGYMDFSLALREMKKGKKVRRSVWRINVWLSISKDGGQIVYQDGEPADYISNASVLATDWEEVL